MSDALYWYRYFREIEVNDGRIVITHLSEWEAKRERRESITSEDWVDGFSAYGKTPIQALAKLLKLENKKRKEQ